MKLEHAKQIANLLNSRNQLVRNYDANIVMVRGDDFIYELKDDSVVGCIEVKKVQWYQWEVCHLTVLPENEGQGLGSLMIRKAEERAKNGGARIIQCTIRVGNAEIMSQSGRKSLAMTKRLLWTPAPIAIAHPTLFTRVELVAYEREILANPTANEHDASRFFKNHPKFLYLGSAAEVRPEVTFRDTLSGVVQRVDFFRRRFGERFWDIVELKDPNKPVLVGSRGLHARLSAEVDKAINQAQDYRDLIDADGEARKKLESKGIRVWRPQIMVVVGKRDAEFEEGELIRSLLDRVRQRGGIEALSYNDIFDFAKEHYSRNHIVCLPATHFTAIDIAWSDLQIDNLIAKIGENPEKLDTLQPRLFEELIARLLQSQGMDVELSPPTRDGGADILGTSRTGVGKFSFAVQCKQLSHPSKIGVGEVRELLGVVYESHMNKGIIITTSNFTNDALKMIEERGYIVTGIDRDGLMQMILGFLEKRRANL
jgi:GNAT superfamily N-acetyltransferase